MKWVQEWHALASSCPFLVQRHRKSRVDKVNSKIMDLHQERNAVSFSFMFILSVRRTRRSDFSSGIECSKESTGESEIPHDNYILF